MAEVMFSNIGGTATGMSNMYACKNLIACAAIL